MTENTQKQIFLCSVAALVCLALSSSALAAEALVPGTSIALDKDKNVTARVDQGPDGLSVSLMAAGSPARTIGLPKDIGAVDTIALVSGSKVAVIGEVSSSGKELLLYNESGTQPVDQILCYQPAISPDGTRVAFTRFFPGHFVNEQQASNTAMLYDIRSGAAGNRAAGTPVSDDQDVGFQLYPHETNAAPTHTFMSDNYFWSPDSTRMIFLDEQYPKPATSAKAAVPRNIHLPPGAGLTFVMVDFTSGSPKVSSFETDICATHTGPTCFVRLTGVEFGATGIKADLKGFDVKAAFQRSVELTPDQFVPLQ
jgi:hypothetical protein